MKRFILRVIIPLFIGFIIYVILSPDTFITKLIWSVLNTNNPFYGTDITKMPFVVKLSRFYLCDILWSFAFTNMLILVLGYKNIRKASIIAILFSTFIELLQIQFIGTFDFWDIIVQVFGCFLAYLLNRKINNPKSIEENNHLKNVDEE